MWFRVAVVMAAALALTAPAIARQQKSVAASSGWIQVPAAGASATAAFVVVDNPTMYDVYLVSAASDVAGKIEFRQTAGGAAPAVVNEVTAPAYDKIEMTADGVHLWLSALTRPLQAGEMVTITLTTDSGVTLQVPATVR